MLELGVGLACLDLRGSRDFLPFGSGPSKIIVLGLIYTLEVATGMSHLHGDLILRTIRHDTPTLKMRVYYVCPWAKKYSPRGGRLTDWLTTRWRNIDLDHQILPIILFSIIGSKHAVFNTTRGHFSAKSLNIC